MSKNRAEQRQRIADALRANPQASNRQIAHDAEAEHKTVASVRRMLVESGDLPNMDRTVGRDGKSRPARRANDGVAASHHRCLELSEVHILKCPRCRAALIVTRK